MTAADEHAQLYLMLYCDDARCRVNTFEQGRDGLCPGCGSAGERLPE